MWLYCSFIYSGNLSEIKMEKKVKSRLPLHTVWGGGFSVMLQGSGSELSPSDRPWTLIVLKSGIDGCRAPFLQTLHLKGSQTSLVLYGHEVLQLHQPKSDVSHVVGPTLPSACSHFKCEMFFRSSGKVYSWFSQTASGPGAVGAVEPLKGSGELATDNRREAVCLLGSLKGWVWNYLLL